MEEAKARRSATGLEGLVDEWVDGKADAVERKMQHGAD
jgi:hypothetical protein